MIDEKSFDRRNFLRGTIATSAMLMAARPSTARTLARLLGPQRRFAPVKVARNRIIREVVGLRPYRPTGFVVEAKKIGNKLLVHNYGHGGAGITLSWGTASLAVDLVRSHVTNRSRNFAVLGSGVNGLSTARLLQRNFSGNVTIYAKDLPPNTTSNIAGGFWQPTSIYDPEQATPKFNEQLKLACQLSNRAFQLLVGPEYGVRWIETFELLRNESSIQHEIPGGATLYPQTEIHRDPEHYFGFPIVRQYNTMLIEPQIYLNALLRDFYIAGGKVVIKEFRNRQEILRLPQPVVFNCTGLGARALFEDKELIPVRGQLEVLLPQPEIDYCYLRTGYMFPRHDGIILGGTFDHDDWSLVPNPQQTTEILNAHAEIMKGLTNTTS